MTKSDIGRSWIGPISILAASIWAFLRAGTGPMSDLSTFTTWASQWPAQSSEPLQQVYANSPIGHILTQLLHATSPSAFLAIHLVTTLLSIAGLAWWAFRNTLKSSRNQAVRLVVLAPVAAILFAWIGYYDSFTALCWVAVLFAWSSRSRWLLAASGSLIGFQHFEQAIIAVTAWIFLWCAFRSELRFREFQNPAWTFIGVFFGKLLLTGVFVSQDIDSSIGRSTWLTNTEMLRLAVSSFVNNGPILLWSFFAGFWVVVLYLLFGQSSRRQLFFLLTAIVLPIVLTAVTFDRPRVFVMTTIPITVMLAVIFAEKTQQEERPQVRYTLEAVVWIATPLIFWGQALFNFGALDRLITLFQSLTL